MGKLFAPIIDKSITAFTDDVCKIVYYLPEGAEGTGVILQKVYSGEDKIDITDYQYFSKDIDTIIEVNNIQQDFVAQLYLVSEDPGSESVAIEAWLKNSDNSNKYSASSDPVAFWHIINNTNETSLSYRYDDEKSKLIVECDFDFENTDIFQLCNLIVCDNSGNVVKEKFNIYPTQQNYIIVELPISNELNKISIKLIYYTIKGFIGSLEGEYNISKTESSVLKVTFLSYSNGIITANINNSNVTYIPYLYRGYYDETGFYIERLINKGETTDSSTYIYEDNTFESGKLYRYRLMLVDEETSENYFNAFVDNCVSFFEDVYLQNLEGTKSLKVRFNPAIDSIKRNFKDTITATLGSDYPYITRAGKSKYRTFNLGGLITIEDDLENVASSKFLSDSAISKIQNLQNQVTEFYDFRAAAEKIYREEVLNFLHSPDIKLFKSTPEGNIYVYLSNISLSVDKVSARNLQSFTCQATEVEDPYINEYTKAKVIDKNIIFFINDKLYRAKEGMSWENWIISYYNDDSIILMTSNDYVYHNTNPKGYLKLNNSFLKGTDNIIANQKYIIK